MATITFIPPSYVLTDDAPTAQIQVVITDVAPPPPPVPLTTSVSVTGNDGASEASVPGAIQDPAVDLSLLASTAATRPGITTTVVQQPVDQGDGSFVGVVEVSKT